MDVKNIVFLANVRLPTEKAHGLQIVKMCEAFAKAGCSVTLVIPNRKNPLTEDVFAYYGVQRTFTVATIPCFDAISRQPFLGPLSYWIEALTFAWSIKKLGHVFSKDTVIFTRELTNCLFLPHSARCVYEAHTLPKRPGKIFTWLLGRMDKIITLTGGLKDDVAALGAPADRILVAPDGTDITPFKIRDTVERYRSDLALPMEKKIIMYTGHLYAWKGVYTLLEAAKSLPQHLFVFVGGTDADRKIFSQVVAHKDVTNVRIIPFQLPARIPQYLLAADVLVLPNSANEKISARYTSPLKLFEYMASERPIIASALPSIQEVLTVQAAEFFTPDDALSLANAIKRVLEQYPNALAKSARARRLVEESYTWDKRAAKIFKFISE